MTGTSTKAARSRGAAYTRPASRPDRTRATCDYSPLARMSLRPPLDMVAALVGLGLGALCDCPAHVDEAGLPSCRVLRRERPATIACHGVASHYPKPRLVGTAHSLDGRLPHGGIREF